MNASSGRSRPGQPRLPIDPELTPGRAEKRVLAAIALGGALGAPARYGVSLLVDITLGTFPWGTFWINVSGSFLLGVLLVVLTGRFPASVYLRPFLGTGVLGAYTTYSTFAVESDLLVRNGHPEIALAYAAASLVAGFAAAWLGMAAARRVVPAR